MSRPRLGGMEAGSYKHSIVFTLQEGSRQLSRPGKAVDITVILNVIAILMCLEVTDVCGVTQSL